MGQIDTVYHQLLKAIMEQGYEYSTENRPGIVYKELPSITLDISLERYPLITTKEIYFKGIVIELLWFLRGDDNIKYLVDNSVNIWNKDAYNWYIKACDRAGFKKLDFNSFIAEIKDEGKIHWDKPLDYELGDVGRNYGVQWREFQSAEEDIYSDQMLTLIRNLQKSNPISRRHIVTAWNPAEVNETALPPCHWSFEVIAMPITTKSKIRLSGGDRIYLETLLKAAEGKIPDLEAQATLDKELKGIPDYGFILKWHQRSVDTFLGLPFNIASYAMLSYLIGELTGLVPLSMVADLSHVHIYGPHLPVVREQLKNNPMAHQSPYIMFSENLKTLAKEFKERKITFETFIQSISFEDFILEEYKSFPKLSAEMFEPNN